MATRTVTDSFTRSNGNLTSNNWDTLPTSTACQIVSNRVQATTTSGGGCHSRYTLPFPADQTSQVSVITWTGSGQARAAARCSSSVYSMYWAYTGGSSFGTNGCILVKSVAGSYVEIGTGSSAAFSAGSTLACDCQGSTIRMLVNSTQIYSVTDSALTSGTPGLGIFVSSAVADIELDDFVGSATNYPVVDDYEVTLGTTASAAPVINLPALTAGNILVAIFRCSLAGAIGWPANWNEIADNATDASANQTAIAWKECLGTEGTTATLSCTSSKFAAIVWSIYNAHTTTAPELSTIATGTSTTPNPTAVTPSGGSNDYLMMWLGGWEGEQTSPPASVPTNYTDLTGADSGTGGAVTTNVRVAAAWRYVTGTTEDPGSWTISVSDDWTAYTMAVYPKVISADVTTSISGTTTEAALGTLTPSGGDVGETGRTSIATDNFNRTNEDPITGNWVSLNDDNSRISLSGNAIRASHPSHAVARWVGAGSFTNDQYSSVVITTLSVTSGFIGASARISADTNANRDHYAYRTEDETPQTTDLLKVVNGSETVLNTTTSVSWSNGNRIEIETEGTTIRGFKSGVQQISMTDSSLSSGLPGVTSYRIDATNYVGGDDWDGGSISEVEVTFKSAWARNCNQLIGVGAR